MFAFKDVIRGCANDKNDAKEKLYKFFYGYLLAVSLRYTNNRAESEEIVNDTFVKIFDAIGSFALPKEEEDALKAFKAWIGKIVSRKAIDYLRAKKSFSSLDDLREDTEPITHVNVIGELNVQDILKLLDKLPKIYRIVFNLYEIEGYTHQEIAKLLAIPESSSRVYLTRSKEKLRMLYVKAHISLYETN